VGVDRLQIQVDLRRGDLLGIGPDRSGGGLRKERDQLIAGYHGDLRRREGCGGLAEAGPEGVGRAVSEYTETGPTRGAIESDQPVRGKQCLATPRF